MTMYNPPHPGEFIEEVYMKPFGLSGRFLAEKLAVSPSTFNRILKKQSGVSPEMALRLSIALGLDQKAGLPCRIITICGKFAAEKLLHNVRKVEFAV